MCHALAQTASGVGDPSSGDASSSTTPGGDTQPPPPADRSAVGSGAQPLPDLGQTAGQNAIGGSPRVIDTTITGSGYGRTLPGLRDGAPGQQGVLVPRTTGRIVRHIDVRANAAVTYDTNAARTNALRPIPDLRRHDFIFPVGLGLDIVIPSGANTYSLNGLIGYDFYLHDTRLNSENIDLSGGYRRAFRSCSGGFDGGLARNRTQFNETGFIGIGLLDARRNIQSTESIGVSLACNVTAGLRPFGSFNFIHARNSSVTRSYADHDTKVFGGGLVDTSTIGEIGVVGSIEDTDYPNRAANRPVGATFVRTKSIGLSFARQTARILQSRVQVNYTAVRDGRGGGSFDGVTGDVFLRLMPGSRFVFTLTADRAASPSLEFNSDYNLTTSYGGTAAARISERVQANLGYEHMHRKLYGAVALPGELLTRDNLTDYFGSVTYRISPRISLLLAVTHERRTTNNAIYDYSGTRGTVGVNVRI